MKIETRYTYFKSAFTNKLIRSVEIYLENPVLSYTTTHISYRICFEVTFLDKYNLCIPFDNSFLYFQSSKIMAQLHSTGILDKFQDSPLLKICGTVRSTGSSQES